MDDGFEQWFKDRFGYPSWECPYSVANLRSAFNGGVEVSAKAVWAEGSAIGANLAAIIRKGITE